MLEKIINYVRAGYSGLCLVSAEESRVDADMKEVALRLERPLYVWSSTSGLVHTENGAVRNVSDPLEAVSAVMELPDDAVVILHDLHLYLEQPDPMLLRVIKDTLARGKAVGQALVLVCCRSVIPPELRHDLTVLEYELPDRDTLNTVLEGIRESASLHDDLPEDERLALLDGARGLTCPEAENAFALSLVEAGTLDARIISREKARAIQNGGILEIIAGTDTLDSLGGLDALKNWLVSRKDAFGARAREYGLPVPKGVLIVGIPGTGKSLCARIIADVFGCPLLKLDTGRLFGSLVGQTEQNLRQVLHTAEAIAPCVLFVDELEKAFSGMRGSGSTDGGVGSRVLGTFLNWMQDKKNPVFIAATANDISQLPPELLRKGRFDDLFFVDLPSETERQAIWDIHVRRCGRDPGKFDCKALALATEGYTGSEIEQAVIEGLYHAFARDMEPTTLTFSTAIQSIVPLSRLSAESVQSIRQWAQGRARSASSTVMKAAKGRKIAA